MDNCQATKKCNECGEVLGVSHFAKRIKSKDGFQHKCKSCCKALNADWYKSNKQWVSEKNKRQRLKDLQAYKNRLAKYAKENLPAYRARNALRYAAKVRATPVWAEFDLIKIVYEKAHALGFEVDHIVPIKSDLVCGLHVWANLQLLSESENCKKKNLFWPDMPEERRYG